MALVKKKRKHPEIKFKIVNMVASSDLCFEIDLYHLANKARDVEYEPEQFPGAILKFKDPKASMLLFKNGKIICTGCCSEKEVAAALKRTVELILKYKK